MKYLKILSTTAVGVMACGTVLAEDKALGEIVVLEKTIEETMTADLENVGSKLEVITREQIDNAGPSKDLNTVLRRYVPGLYAAPKNGPFDYGHYSLLGSRSTDILILLDGVRLNNRLYGGLYLDTISSNAIERIEVLKGGQSLYFGTEAVAGVINLITRKPQEGKQGEVSTAVDSVGGVNAEGYYAKTHGRFDIVAFTSKDRSDGFQPYQSEDFSATATDRRRSYDVNNIGTKLTYRPDDSARATLFYQFADAKLDFSRPTDNRETFNDRKQHIVTGSFEKSVSDSFSYNLKSHFNRWDTDYTRIYNVAGGGVNVRNMGDPWGFEDYGVQSQGRVKFLQGQELIFGADVQQYKGWDQVLVIRDQKATSYGFYGQIRPKFDFAPDTNLAAGARYQKVDGGEEALVWNLSGRQYLGERAFVRGQVGTSFRLPNAWEMFGNDSCCAVGNADLKPEKSTNYELGAGYDADLPGDRTLSVEGTLFYREIEDLIGTGLVNGVNTRVNTDGTATTRGMEINTNLDWSANWKAGLDATFTLTEDGDGAAVTRIPKQHYKAFIGFTADSGQWGAELAGRYVGAIFDRNVDYGHYTVFDASAYYRFGDDDSHKLSLGVENILDRDYASQVTTNSDTGQVVDVLGRPLTAELRYSYSF